MEGSIQFDAHVVFGSWPETAKTISELGRKANVLLLLVTTKPEDWNYAVELSKSASYIDFAIGVHPWFSGQVPEGWLDNIEQIIKNNESFGVGEIGLDFAFRTKSNHYEADSASCMCTKCVHKRSQFVFSEQLRLASIFNRWCSIHCVRAFTALLSVLNTQKQSGKLPKRINLHSWSGSVEMTKEILRNREFRERVYFGVSAQVNFRNLFEFSIEAGPLDSWQPCHKGDWRRWKREENGSMIESDAPWKTNQKNWRKFSERVNSYPRNRILLESDLPATTKHRPIKIHLAAHVVADAIDISPTQCLALCQKQPPSFPIIDASVFNKVDSNTCEQFYTNCDLHRSVVS